MARTWLPVLLVFFLVACAPTKTRVPLPDGTLTADEVRALFSGKTVKSVTFSKGRVSDIYYGQGGELRQVRNDEVRAGTWKVKNNGRLCMKIAEGKKRCRIIVRTGSNYVKYVVRNDGNHEPVVRYISFEKGDALGR